MSKKNKGTRLQKVFRQPNMLNKMLLNTTNDFGCVRIHLTDKKYLWIFEPTYPGRMYKARVTEIHQMTYNEIFYGPTISMMEILNMYQNLIPEEILMRILFHLDELR